MAGAISGLTPWRRSRISVAVAQPAAGADWSLTVPAGHVYSVVAAMGIFTASAAVASRVPRLVFSDGAASFLYVPPIASVTAGGVARMSWFEHAGGQNVGNGQSVSIPSVNLPAGGSLSASTTAIDVGDQWSGLFVYVVDTTTQQGPVTLEDAAELNVIVLGQPAG